MKYPLAYRLEEAFSEMPNVWLKIYKTMANNTGIRIVPINCAFALAASCLKANPVQIPIMSVKIKPIAMITH